MENEAKEKSLIQSVRHEMFLNGVLYLYDDAWPDAAKKIREQADSLHKLADFLDESEESWKRLSAGHES